MKNDYIALCRPISNSIRCHKFYQDIKFSKFIMCTIPVNFVLFNLIFYNNNNNNLFRTSTRQIPLLQWSTHIYSMQRIYHVFLEINY